MSSDDDLLQLTRKLHVSRRAVLQPEHWRPPTDVYRTREGWLVKMELAGVRPQDVSVHVSDRLLTVRGMRYDLDLTEGCRFHSLEIAYTAFERTLELPFRLEQARILTEFRQGMLLVRVLTEATHP